MLIKMKEPAWVISPAQVKLGARLPRRYALSEALLDRTEFSFLSTVDQDGQLSIAA